MKRFAAYLKKDGWIWAALALCIALCLMGGAFGETSEEERISRVLSQIEGAGTVEVAVSYAEGLPSGAVVVAQGAKDVGVRLNLISAISSLLGIDQHRVAVYGMGE